MLQRYFWAFLIVIAFLSGIFGTFTFVRLSGLEDSVFTETEIAAIARKEVETKSQDLQTSDFLVAKSNLWMDPNQLINNYITNQKQLVIDLRSSESYNQSHLIEAFSIPKNLPSTEILNQLKQTLDQVGSDLQIVLYDDQNFSHEAVLVASFLSENGIQSKVLSLGFSTFVNPETNWNKTGIELATLIQAGEQRGRLDRDAAAEPVCQAGYLVCVN
jgi:rhodanese-related sulfurtransferase